MSLADTSWMEDGACRDAEVDLWFVERGESSAPAREICARCPVADRCLEYALAHHIKHGIWGGLTERERRRMARSRRAA